MIDEATEFDKKKKYNNLPYQHGQVSGHKHLYLERRNLKYC